MSNRKLKDLYFDWLYSHIRTAMSHKSRKLLKYLFNTEFRYSIYLDSNRASDGIDLRYKFGDAYGFHQAFICSELDNQPCSVLEMMVALAIRCEEQLMWDPELGDRTSFWFWNMIGNIGYDSIYDEDYDEHNVYIRTNLMLDRNYASNGVGGLFTVDNPPRDMREVDIWCQLNWFLASLRESYYR